MLKKAIESKTSIVFSYATQKDKIYLNFIGKFEMPNKESTKEAL